MIYWIEPYRSDKDIGKAYNEVISLLPPHSMIGITDHDVAFMLPQTKAQIETIVEKGGYDLYTCKTNRIGWNSLCEKGMFDEDSISAHMAKAIELFNQKAYVVSKCKLPSISGFLMVFNKDLWEAKGGFLEGEFKEGNRFDATFSENIKVGVMEGVYVLHLYRWGKDNPKTNTKHLKMKNV